MEANFWISAWDEGRTGFHQGHYHDKLLKYFPALGIGPKDKVLVPLCGKTLDMIWLKNQKNSVHGIELYEAPVKAFFEENQLKPLVISKDKFFTNYTFENITVSAGDFFKIDRNIKYDFIYDRAALVALPLEMRREYAKVLKDVLKPTGKYLLIVYEYNQDKMEGPPFSISQDEIHSLYQSDFEITLLEEELSHEKGPKFSKLPSLKQKVFLLTRK